MKEHLFLVYESYTTDFAEVEELVGDHPGTIRKALMVRVAQSFDDETITASVQIDYPGRGIIGTYSLAKGSKIIVDYELSEVRFTHHVSQYVVRIPKGRMLGTEVGAVNIVAGPRLESINLQGPIMPDGSIHD